MPSLGDWLFGALKYAAIVPLVYCLVAPVYRRTLHPLSKFPGPLFASLTDLYAGYFVFRQDMHRQVLRNHEKYGPVVRHGPNRLVFNTISALKAIHQSPRVSKSFVYELMSRLNGYESVLDVIDKQDHRQKRRLVGRGLNDSALRVVQPAVNDQIDVLLKRILAGAEEERSLNMTAIVKPFTFDAMTAAVFSHPLNMQTSDDEKWISDDFTESNTRLNHYLNVPDLFRLHVHNLTDLLQIRLYMKFADLITQMVTTAEEAQSNIFTILERAAPKDEEGSVDESEVLQESLLLIAAGPDTMAAAICATLFYLSRHKESYHRLSDEIRSSFSKGTNINPGPQLMSCRYLRACIDESLRMSPPGAGVLWREQDLHSRNSRETLTIDGHVIPPGTQFGVGIYALHHNEDYFPSPFTYKPERWFDSETSAKQLKLMHDAFSPFSIGARSCPGKTMAYTQMSLVLAKVLWYFDFETTPGYLGRIGLRNVPLSYGEIEDEYDSSDIFVAKHDGPHLIFKAREDVDGLHL